jgi:prepilin-type N-terminal cleavage/methylation domain-containing protein
MDTEMNPPCHLRSARKGFTLIELITAMVAAFIVMMTAGVLLYSGQRSWLKTYNDNNSESRVGALNTMIALGALGRKSNRMNYHIYEVDGDNFEPLLPSAEPEEVVIGQAVEFRYWDTELDADLMDKDKTATAYALFYLEGDELKIDFGPFPPGGVSEAGRRIIGDGITTVSMVKHVASAEFSHTTRDMAGDGKGCVRMKLTIANSVDGSAQTVLAATLMRNTWP